MNGPSSSSDRCSVQPEIAAAVAGLSNDLRARFVSYEREERAVEHELPYAWRALDRVLADARERGERRRVEDDRRNRADGGKG